MHTYAWEPYKNSLIWHITFKQKSVFYLLIITVLQNCDHATKGVMSMLKTSGFKYATIEATNAFTSKAKL